MHKNKCSLGILATLMSLVVFKALADPAPPEGDEKKSSESNEIDQTVVEDVAPKSSDTQFFYYKDTASDQTPDEASMLFHIPGLTLTQTGGPQTPATIRYRGLANANLRLSLEELTLNSPLNGMRDANSMFLFAAQSLHSNAQALTLTLPHIESSQAKAIFGYGSQNSIKLGASAGTPIDPYSSIFVATQTSSTDGRFHYSSPDLPKNDDNNDFVRENNDQHRLQTIISYRRKKDSGGAHVLFASNFHEGGISGFAFSPNQRLRHETIYSGLSIGGHKKIRAAELSLELNNSLFDYRSYERPVHEQHLLASTHELIFRQKSLKLPKWLDFDMGQKIVVERAHRLKKTRVGGGFVMKRTMSWTGRLKPSTFANFSMVGYDGHGLVFRKDFGLSLDPSPRYSITARFVRNQRLPTFMEMYSNNRYFVGNEGLKKESIWDIELGSNLHVAQSLHLQLTGFFGYLTDYIAYVPFANNRMHPINVGSARRYGLDLGLTFMPLDWLLFETKDSFLRTKNKSTDAPLPHSPSFSGLTKVRIGDEEHYALSVLARYQTQSNASIHGTLISPGYTVFDALISTKFYERINLSLSVNNIFNIKTARDTYEIPLPGTTYFTQIEVGNI